MPKKKPQKGGAPPEIDEQVLEDTILITNEIFESDALCREIVEGSAETAIEFVHQKERDAIERTKAATDILNGFITYGQWCHMPKDPGISDQELDGWKQEPMPKRIVPDSWSSHSIPTRKVAPSLEDAFVVESHSKAASVRSGQSGRSRLSKASLRSKLRMASSGDVDFKKPLGNIVDELTEEQEAKVEIIKLDGGSEKGKTKGGSGKRKSSKSKGGKNAKSKKPGSGKSESKDSSASMLIDVKKGDKQSMSIGLKTGRMSMRSANVYKYHPNKPFTYDHTGQKMSVTHIKPEKIPSNVVTPLVSFEEDTAETADGLDKKGKKARGSSVGMGRKSRKKASSKSSKASKSLARPVAHKTNSVPVQPPIESIIKVEGGVSLKTKNATIKGKERRKNKISNLSRSEYNRYIETLKHTAAKTHVFQTHDDMKRKGRGDSEDTTRPSTVNNENTRMAHSLSEQETQSMANGLMSGSPKSLRYRTKNTSPKSIKFKRGRMSQQTDRMISEHNKSTLLPSIEVFPSKNYELSDKPLHELSMATDLQLPPIATNHTKYQKRFMVSSPSQKIEKSKLGKELFGGE